MGKEANGRPARPAGQEYGGQQIPMNLTEPSASFQAICESIIFRNEENGYTVASFSRMDTEAEVTEGGAVATEAKKPSETFTGVGSMPFLEVGDYLLLAGKWTTHSSYGRQLQVQTCTQVTLHTPQTILKYLSSGVIRGIGPKLAEKIVSAFGTDTLAVMREKPERLAKIRGITKDRAREISEQMIEKGAFQELSLLLNPFGIGMSRILNIYRRYGSAALYVVKNNPYRLAEEVSGIGFHTADRLAAQFGCDPNSPFRIGSAVLHCMAQSESDGNTYIRFADLIEKTKKILKSSDDESSEEDADEPAERAQAASARFRGLPPNNAMPPDRAVLPDRATVPERAIPPDKAMAPDSLRSFSDEGLKRLVAENKILAYRVDETGNFSLTGPDELSDDVRIAFPKSLETEIAAAKIISGMAGKKPVNADFRAVKEKIANSASEMGIELAPEQEKAVLCASNAYVSIITGGPGTGKTTIIRVLTDYFKSEKQKAVLCAPTGRAAKRMSEASGIPARTIHRLLEIERGTADNSVLIFKRNEENPIEADAVIVDETSMLDSFLFLCLIRAIGPDTQLILVGDSDQLPSVGTGNVLFDLIRSGIVHTEKLTQIYRQAALSRIVQSAHRVLTGQPILFNQEFDSDCMLVSMSGGADIANAVVRLVSQVLPNVYGIDVMRDVAVLCPSRKGPAGITALNELLQAAVGHTGEPHIAAHGITFRLLDKVMQTRNNYELEFANADGTKGTGVFNGELGIIRRIDRESDTMTVETDDGRTVIYERVHMDDLDLAFAVTVHKSQGSEYPVVILAVPPGSPMLNNRNLLYTAITRAKKRLFVVSSKSVLERMIHSNSQGQRLTSLCDFLRIYAGQTGGRV